MRWIALLAVCLLASPAAAQNLLDNPNFDLDPTVGGNGWSTLGTGSFTWDQAAGDPSAPSARTAQNNAESMILYQCVPIVGGATYDFSARSYTNSSGSGGTNSVSLSVYSTTDCSGSPIETVSTDALSFPSWALRERVGYVAPMNAQSARIELTSSANGGVNDISWDTVMLNGEGPTDSVPKTWGVIKALYR